HNRSQHSFPTRRSSDLCDQIGYYIGPKDYRVLKRIAGDPHYTNYRRMITVYVDITAPLYWWKEFDAYKVGTVANSCSTMHKIARSEEHTSELQSRFDLV